MTTSVDSPVILRTGDDGIARLRLNRPDASNGLNVEILKACLLYTSPSPRDRTRSRMPSSA